MIKAIPHIKNKNAIVYALLKMGLQFAFFWFLNELGHRVTTLLSLPIPGNIVGIVLLFVLLLTGFIKVQWIELGGSMLTRHMGLFFIPITVGIMGYTELFKTSGTGILTVIILSACIGLVACGLSIQFVQSRKGHLKFENGQTVSRNDVGLNQDISIVAKMDK